MCVLNKQPQEFINFQKSSEILARKEVTRAAEGQRLAFVTVWFRLIEAEQT